MMLKSQKKFKSTGIRSIQLVIKYSRSISLNDLTKKFRRIDNILIYDYGGNKIKNEINDVNILTFEKPCFDKNLCGCISPFYFTSNISMFTESKSKNSCLNKKISIDIHGNIKNCPSMPQSFGNIKDTSLEEALNHPDFKKYWNITKDQIDVCRDCEFRYICTDCRAYVVDSKDIHSKPVKCNYNPYIAKWESE